jgi:hypothetical protein
MNNSVGYQCKGQYHREHRGGAQNHGYGETQTLAAFQVIASKGIFDCQQIVGHRRTILAAG